MERHQFIDTMVSMGKRILEERKAMFLEEEKRSFGEAFANALESYGRYKAANHIGVGIAQIDFAIKEDPGLKLNTLLKLADLLGYKVEIKLVRK